ncbi:MAG: hypothetical protein WC788_00515 [Candidatus Paceibacterota bacterium]|jgi:hypothetical protein
MIGDLIILTLLSIIWWKLLKLKKDNFRGFVFEFTIYLLVFAASIALYKISFFLLSLVFQFELFPSIVGVFSLSFFLLYSLVRISLIYLSRKNKFTPEARESITGGFVRFYDRIFPNIAEFEKAVRIFMAINIVIILTLFNSFFDAFTHQRILNYENSAALDEKAGYLLRTAKGPLSGIKNLSDTLDFLRAIDPRAYEKIVSNTESFVFPARDMGLFLGLAHMPDNLIEINGVFASPFDSVEDNIFFASVLVHEAEHLKNFRSDAGFVGNIVNYAILSARCNPVTNYEYFSDITRSIFMYGDEWCAQVSEVKFFRQFNVDYRSDWMRNFKVD